MKLRNISAAAAFVLAANLSVYGAVVLNYGGWTVDVDESSKAVVLSRGGSEIFKDVSASSTFQVGDGDEQTFSTGDVVPSVAVNDLDDIFGTGKELAVTYAANGVKMVQTLGFYADRPYFIAQLKVSADNGSVVRSNRMVPFYTGSPSSPMGGSNNRILWVPYDNDGHVDYKNTKIGAVGTYTSESHEVGCVHNTDTRFGIVAGSVDHDTWKNGVIISGRYTNQISQFECLSGMSNYYTRDGIPHGKVKGTSVSSARFMVGAFDDWREGLDAFAEANTVVAPPAEWTGGNPIGWSSYGSQQELVNYDGVMESARYIRDELFDLGFHNKDGQTVISLDACAEDNIPAQRLATMASKAFGDGTTYSYGGKTYEGMNMVLGLYGGPFCIWEWALGSKVKGTGLNGEPSYTFNDMALKVNGELYKLPSNGAYASDPTHPAVRAYIKQTMKDYNARGTKYLKVDFMNCGMVQGDSYYDPEITTAVQAYNYGMKILKEEADNYGMYLVMAMSPAFPYQYVHGRRTCCDRFSEIGESEYVMNATSYGFWMDKLYTVCDPDQMVLCKNDAKMRETEGENRARATTGMTTGAFIFGDNFSEKVVQKDGVVRGYPAEAMRRARFIMGNADINAYVRENTGCFRPVNGKGEYVYPNTSETVFVRHTPQYTYVAVFNFSSVHSYSGTVSFDHLGIDPDDVGDIKELWFGSDIDHNGSELAYDVPVKDARVYRITNLQYSGIDNVETEENGNAAAAVDIFLGADGGCNIRSPRRVCDVRVYGVDGRLLGAASGMNDNEISLPVAGNPAVAVAYVTFTDGDTAVRKVARSFR